MKVKNRTLRLRWLIMLLMASFLLLFVVQVVYIKKVYETKDEQFDRLVKVALSGVSYKLELDEMRMYLYESLMPDSLDFASTLEAPTGLPQSHPHNVSVRRLFDRDLFLGFIDRFADSLSFEHRASAQVYETDGSLLSQSNRVKNRDTASKLQLSWLSRYLHKRDLLDEVILRSMMDSQFRSAKQRIKINRLTEVIRNELSEVGLETPFVYKLYNTNGKLEYFETLPQYKDVTANDHNTIRQYLFLCEGDQSSQGAYIDVTFPDKTSYTREIYGFAILTGMSALILLLFSAIATIILYKNQTFAQTKSDFINNMTHELKTPVSSISLANQMMKDKAIMSNPQTMSRLIGVVSNETQRLSMLIEKVLQFSLFEEKQMKLKLEELDANEIILSVAEVYTFKAQQTGGDLYLALEAENTWIYADEMHFTNVIFNLLENAVKYRQPNRELLLKISSRNVGKKIEITIQDNGIGIPQDSLTRIFKRFYRVHTGNRHDVKGFGLGLAYVHMVLSEMGGSIKCESEVGTGSKMIITMPNIKQTM